VISSVINGEKQWLNTNHGSHALPQAMAILPHWFTTRRSFAMGMATSGAGLGGFAYSVITDRLVGAFGIPWTYRILSICCLVANTTCALFLREHDGTTDFSGPCKTTARFRDYLCRIEIVLVGSWGFLTEFGYVALLYMLPFYATSVGLSPSQGSTAQAVLNLGLGIGRPVVGFYSDRAGRINVALGATLLCGTLCLTVWVTSAGNYGLLLAFALCAGLVSGTFWTTVGPVLAEVVGLPDFAGAFGLVCFTLVLPNTFADAIAMQLVDSGPAGSRFLVAQIFVGVTFVLGAGALWLLRTWRIYELDHNAEPELTLRDGPGLEVDGVITENRWLTFQRLVTLRSV
jgi:MFS family permease